ncbi:MAG: hypothetical protein LBC63_00105 [Holophagales bacterium]|jgi:hypothetical protein|nr:hypothetical protein [Holophagales bacterium]
MAKMSETLKARLEEQYGKPLEDQAEIERRFKNAIAKIDVGEMARRLVHYNGEKLNYGYNDITVYRYRPPYDDKIALYFGDDIDNADKWEANIYESGHYSIPYGQCNKNRILIRGDWAAYYLADAEGESQMAEFLEDLITGDFWMVVS